MDFVFLGNSNVTSVINALFAYQYINVTTNPAILGSVLRTVLQSNPDLARLANSTGLSVDDIGNIIVDIYSCINKTAIVFGNPMKDCLNVQPTQKFSLDDCLDLRADTNALVLLVLGVFSYGTMFVASVLNKRRSACPNCLYGRPAPVVPLNMLDSYENRFGNALAFGVTTSYCLDVLFGSPHIVVGSRIGKVIAAAPSSINIVFKILSAMVISNAAYPLFVCMRTKFKVIASLFGIFYCTAWLALLILRFYVYYHGCIKKLTGRSEVTQVFEGVGEIPQFVCLILLLIRFINVMVMYTYKKPKGWSPNEDHNFSDFQEMYMIKHVTNLLKAVPIEKNIGKESLKVKIKKKVYKWKPEFRYSTRVISAFMVSGITIYILTVKLLFAAWYFDAILKEFVDTETFKTTVTRFFPNYKTLLKEIRNHLGIWLICLYVSIGIASVKTYFVFLNMLAWYRGHITRLRKGDKSWLPTSIQTLSASPTSLMAAGMKYAGFQVAYIAWGFIVFVFIMELILGVISSFLLYPLVNGKTSLIIELLIQVWPAILLSLLLYVFQFLAAKFVFLQQKGAIISVDNRNIFHISSYYMFFFNMFLGLFSCLMRILKGVAIGVLFLERVQKSLLPRSFEKMDPGYFAYVGYILVEHYHANPVICVFSYLLKQQFKDVKMNRASMAIIINSAMDFSTRALANESETGIEMDERRFSMDMPLFDRRKIIRNRWNLFYTLVNNPSLVKYRKSKGDDEEETDEKKETSKFYS